MAVRSARLPWRPARLAWLAWLAWLPGLAWLAWLASELRWLARCWLPSLVALIGPRVWQVGVLGKVQPRQARQPVARHLLVPLISTVLALAVFGLGSAWCGRLAGVGRQCRSSGDRAVLSAFGLIPSPASWPSDRAELARPGYARPQSSAGTALRAGRLSGRAGADGRAAKGEA
jgi:hypothetical protein